jgi:hypothetical protein
MKHKGFYIVFLMTLMSLTTFAQHLPVETDSIRQEKYRTEIGIDMSVPDFDTKTIDAKVMGSRLAGILNYMLENYHQPTYSRKICQILKEQREALENQEFELKKIQFNRAKKSGDEITLFFTVWPDKNFAKVKQAEVVFLFKNGVSGSQATNELFSMISRYVQARERLAN